MSTITQLLADGADPKLVVCPQPALQIAILASSSELVRLLIRNGADVNATYIHVSIRPQLYYAKIFVRPPRGNRLAIMLSRTLMVNLNYIY